MTVEPKTLPTRVRWLLYICAGLGFGIITASLDAWHQGKPLLTPYSLTVVLFAAVFFSLIYGIGMEVLTSHRRGRARRDDHPAA